MNSLQRFQTALKLEHPDKVPLFYQYMGAANTILNQLGQPCEKVYYDADQFAEFQLKGLEMFGHDNIMTPGGCLTIEAEILGAEVVPQKRQYPSVDERLAKDPEKVKLSGHFNIDIQKQERGRQVLQATNLLSKSVGDSVAIIGAVTSPTLVLTQLMGYETTLKCLLTSPEEVHSVLEKITMFCQRYSRMLLEEGAHGVMIENSMTSQDTIQQSHAREFIMKYTQEVVREVQETGGFAILHNCSAKPYLDLEIEIAPDALVFWKGNLGTLKKRYVKNVCLMGNLDHTQAFQSCTPAETRKLAEKVIQKGKDKGGYIFTTGCEIPHETRMENVIALKEARENVGTYS